jgi:hypothetical protein
MAHRKRLAPSMACVRSAVSNGSSILDVDGRSAWMRRLRDLIDDHTAQMANDVSEAEKRLIRRSAMLTLQLEMQEQRWAANAEGEATPKQLESYQRATNTLRRVLECLGLRRRTRTVGSQDSETLELWNTAVASLDAEANS